MGKPGNNGKQDLKVLFNKDTAKYSAGNVTQMGTISTISSKTNVKTRVAAIHLSINVEKMVEKAFNLTEGKVRQIISAMMSQLGWQTNEEIINNAYDGLIKVLSYSANAHACLIKLWQVQNGRLSTDINGNDIGTSLFMPTLKSIPNRLDLDLGVSTVQSFDGLVTLFDDKISNAVWLQDYVNQLQFTFTNASMRQLLVGLYGPIFSLSKGISPAQTYVNVWTQSLNPKDDFLNSIRLIREITSSMPYLTQILAYLGYEVGSELDLTRDLAQRTLVINEDSSLIELLLSTESGLNDATEQFDQSREVQEDMDNLFFGSEDTPFAVSPFMAFDVVSLYSLLNGYTDIFCRNSTNMPEAITFSEFYSPHIMFNFDAATLLNSTNFENSTKALIINNALYLNSLALQNNALLDIDNNILVYINYEEILIGQGIYNFKGGLSHVEIFTSYGSYYSSLDTRELSHKASATAMVFGATYESFLDEKLNSIPQNIIKFI